MNLKKLIIQFDPTCVFSLIEANYFYQVKIIIQTKLRPPGNSPAMFLREGFGYVDL